jgi:hypothetical protein
MLGTEVRGRRDRALSTVSTDVELPSHYQLLHVARTSPATMLRHHRREQVDNKDNEQDHAMKDDGPSRPQNERR